MSRAIHAKLSAFSTQFFSIDVRALALMRITIGTLFLYDLLLRFTTIPEHYGNWSMFPTYLTSTFWNGNLAWSVHTFFGGAPGWIYIVFCMHIAIGVAYVVGYKTRYTQFVFWFLMISLHHANPLITQGGDVWGRVVLFTLLFLPTGAVWSVDAYLKRYEGPAQIHNGWTMALLIQIALFYFFASQFKTGHEWETGNAIYYALSGHYYPKLLGTILVQYPTFLVWLAHFITYLQVCTPLLIFFPWKTLQVRMTVVTLLVLMHIGLGLSLRVGHFSLMSIAVLCAFIPSVVFARIPRAHIPRTEFSRKNILHLITYACAIPYIIYIFVYQVSGTPRMSAFVSLPQPLLIPAQVLRIDEFWNIFAPPLDVRGWNILAGEKENKEVIDLLRDGAPVDFSRPARIPELSLNSHQWRFLREIDFSHDMYKEPALRYMCKRWNTSHPYDRVKALSLIYMSESISLPGMVQPRAEPLMFYTVRCM